MVGDVHCLFYYWIRKKELKEWLQKISWKLMQCAFGGYNCRDKSSVQLTITYIWTNITLATALKCIHKYFHAALIICIVYSLLMPLWTLLFGRIYLCRCIYENLYVKWKREHRNDCNKNQTQTLYSFFVALPLLQPAVGCIACPVQFSDPTRKTETLWSHYPYATYKMVDRVVDFDSCINKLYQFWP